MRMNKESKNILFITSVPSGLRKFFFAGEEVYTGMPAFKEVLLPLLNDERLNRLYIILFIKKIDINKVNIPDRFQDKIFVKSFYFDIENTLRSISSMFMALLYGIYIILNKKIYSIAGFSSNGSFLAAILGLLTGKKNLRRLFGTFLYSEINSSNMNLFFKHPLEFLSMYIPKGVVLITNDGTRGDRVYEKINRSNKFRPELKFLLNGLDLEYIRNFEPIRMANMPNKYFSYVARIEKWKRQHLLLLALGHLKKSKIDIPTTFFVGKIIDEDYFRYLNHLLIENNLVNHVVFLNEQHVDQVFSILKNSHITFAFYEFSSLGNVFLESIAFGTVIMAANDTNSLASIPNEICIKIEQLDPKAIADMISKVMHDDKFLHSVSYSAMHFANNNINSWSRRSRVEIEYLLNSLT